MNDPIADIIKTHFTKPAEALRASTPQGVAETAEDTQAAMRLLQDTAHRNESDMVNAALRDALEKEKAKSDWLAGECVRLTRTINGLVFSPLHTTKGEWLQTAGERVVPR